LVQLIADPLDSLAEREEAFVRSVRELGSAHSLRLFRIALR
jgi:hypothetical protein